MVHPARIGGGTAVEQVRPSLQAVPSGTKWLPGKYSSHICVAAQLPHVGGMWTQQAGLGEHRVGWQGL
jgi:hypothetical protein